MKTITGGFNAFATHLFPLMVFILLFATGRAHAQVTIEELDYGSLGVPAVGNILAMSSDGSAVFYQTSEDSPEGSFTKVFRWTSAGVQQIGEDLPAGSDSYIDYINTNGTVATGEVYWYEEKVSRGFAWRWTSAGGLVEIGGTWQYPNSSLAGTSSDGSVLVGTRSDGIRSRAFRWKNGVTTDLFLDDDIDSDVYSGVVSPDGSVVVGRSWSASNPDAKHIFRWTSAGVQQIGEDLPAGSDSYIDYINTNGTVVAGNVSWYDAGQGESGGFAWRWTSAGGRVEIGVSLEYPISSFAGTSSDGSVLVGTRSDGIRSRAFRWKNGVTTDLFLDDDIDSDVYSGVVSPDGSVVVGRSWSASNPDAKHIFRWTSAGVQQIGEDLSADSWFEVDYVNTNGTVAAGDVSWYGAGPGESGGFAWHWTSAGGLVVIGVSSEYPNSSLEGTSSDGSVLVGTSSDEMWGGGSSRAFRWKKIGVTPPVTTYLDPLAGDTDSDVYVGNGIYSSDGSVVVGRSWNALNPIGEHICRWSISSTNVVTRQQIGTVPSETETPFYVYGGASGDLKAFVGSVGFQLDPAYFVDHAAVSFQGVITDIGILLTDPDVTSHAVDISSNGLVVLGDTEVGDNEWKSFRWSELGGAKYLNPLAGDLCYAAGVSGDGTVIVGGSYRENPLSSKAVKWVGSSVTPVVLPSLSGYPFSWASSTNSDGSVIVGNAAVSGILTSKAVKWTGSGAPIALSGQLPNKEYRAEFVSGDGSTVLGIIPDLDSESHQYEGYAFRWTAAGGMEVLERLSYGESLSSNYDGTVVVWEGLSSSTEGSTSFLWTQSLGIVELKDYLANQGVDTEFLYFYNPFISSDGTKIAVDNWLISGLPPIQAPTSVAATDGTLTTGVKVTWAASSGATGYKIYRDGSEPALATVGAVLTYSDTSAVPGISYAYTLRAITTAGLSAASLSNTGYRNLTAPLSVAATDGASTSEVTVTWAASTGATGYQVFRSGTVAAIGTVAAVLTYSDTTAIAGTLYTYTVKATGAVGVSVASLSNTGYRNLIAPLSVAATDGTSTANVTVTWAGSSGATGYQVWRALGDGVAAQIGTVGAVLTYSDATAVPGTLYAYSVKATTAAGATVASASDTGYRNLTAPLSVAATDGTLTTGVTVTWAASTGATGYQVWRAIGAGAAAQITTVGAVLTYSDTTAIAGTSYTYTVKATGAVGVSAASLGNTGYRNLTAPLSVAATDGTLTTGVTVTWAASIGATGYQVWRAIGAGVAAQITTVGAVLTYSDTTAIAGTLYTYTVKATGAFGVSAASLGNTGYRQLSAPLTVAATDGTLTTGVKVTWAASSGATGYKIYRDASESALATVGAVLTYSDTSAVPGVSYAYTVRAITVAGLSASSLSNTGYRNLTAPLSVAATDGTSTSGVTVTWAASTGATGYQVFRSGTAAAIGTVGAVVTFSDTTAIAGTSYTYTVKATGAVGVSAASLGNTGYRNLTAPLSVAATDGTLTTGVTVTWAASTGATGYQVFRSGTAAAIGTVGAVLTYSDATAVPGTLYTYSVKATGAVGVSAASVGDVGYRQLSAPLTVAATDGTLTTGVTVTWAAASGATGYKIYRDGSESALATVGAVVTYSDTSAVPGISYAYTVRAITVAGLSASSLSNTGYRNLTAPLSVAATDGSSTSEVTVTWAASTGATGYQVFRSGTAAAIGTVGAVVTFSDTTAIAGTLYTYTVKATGAVGVSAASLGNTGYRNLTAPLSVAATDGTSTANVTVTWAASSGATGYQVWRVIGAGVAAQIGTVGAVLTYSDATAVPGTLYTYSVKATGAVGVSAASVGDVGYRQLSAPLTVAATDGTLTTGVTVTWAAASGATGYKIYRDGSESALATVGAVVTYSDTSAVPGISYAYTVRAITVAGLSASSLSNTGYRNLTAPLSVAATDGSSTSEVTVTWAASTGATGYQVFRSGTAAAIGTVGAVVTFSDTTAIAGTLYTYTVKATGAVGVSAASLGNTGYRNLNAPLSVAATDGTLTTGVTVTWAASSGATGYQVWRALGDGVAAQIGTVGAVLTYSDTTAVAGTLYTYSVKAVAAAGATAASATDTGYRNLTAPLSLAATDGTLTTGVTVTWAASTGATGYQVWRAIGTGVAAQIATAGVVLTYSDTTAIAGTSYTYTVKATGAVGVSLASLSNTGYRNLIAPLSVAATDGSSTSGVTVTWAASTGATGYQVFRSGTVAAIAVNVVSNSFIDSSTSGAPLPGTLYTYTVKATGAVGVSAASLGNTGYRNRVGPATVTATDTDTTKVLVSWTAITGTPAATGYEVWRTIGESAPVPIATMGNTLFTYDDLDIDPGVTALYSVRAKYVLVGSSPATTVRTLPTSDTGIRPVGATGGGDEGGIAGGPESSTALPGGSGNKGDESENAAGSGDSQNAATDPADDGTENPQGEVKPEVKPEEKPDACMTIALALADQIDELEIQLKESVKDESATAIAQKLLDRMRMLMEPTIDNERAVCAMARGDVTLDGVIDNDDLGSFLESWSAGDLIGADLNRDGRITATDMAIVLSAIDAASGNGNPKTE